MKIECSGQLVTMLHERRTDKVTPCAPKGANNGSDSNAFAHQFSSSLERTLNIVLATTGAQGLRKNNLKLN